VGTLAIRAQSLELLSVLDKSKEIIMSKTKFVHSIMAPGQ
jgi:hypothetical protein